MALFQRLLLLLLLLLLKANNANAQSNYCYCIYPNNDGRCYANTACWACAPGAYSTAWQQQFCLGYTAPVTCTSSFTERTEACQTNYSGIKKYKQETKTCTDGQITTFSWQLYSNTCIQNPPTCQISSQTQTLSCQTGYTGSITQTRSSTCPDPYGTAVWGAWVTSTNTCVKSMTNPTSVTSPVSVISPVAQPATQTQLATSSAQTAESSVQQQSVQTDAKATSQTQTQTKTETKSQVQLPKQSVKEFKAPPKGLTTARALSLDKIRQEGMKQMNPFPTEYIKQEMDKNLLFEQLLKLDALKQDKFDQSKLKDELELKQDGYR